MQSHLFKYHLKPNTETDVTEWLEFAKTHRDEILATLKTQCIYVEDVFIEENGPNVFLYYYVRTENLQKALDALKRSTLAVDEYQKSFFTKVTRTRVEIKKILGLDS